MAKRSLVETGARLEASLIGVPTGKQDYLAALYGGLSAHHFGMDGWRVERLAVSRGFLGELERRLVVAYTGESRLSAATNWEKFKAYVEDTGSARQSFARIKAIAEEMRSALLAEDLEAVGSLLRREWAERRRLVAGVSSPELDAALGRARRAGGLGGKLCGAGGGGCLAVLTGRERTEAVEAVFRRAGWRLLPCRIARRGLVVVQDEAG